MQENYLVTPATSGQIVQQAEIQSQSQAALESAASVRDIELRRVKEFTLPSLVRSVLFLGLSIIFLVSTNIKIIVSVLNRSVVENQPFMQSIPAQLKFYTDNQIVSWITIVLFWGTVGLAAYTLFWLGSAFVTAARNEMIVETAFSNRGHFWDKVRVPMIKLVMLVVISILLIFAIRFGAPVFSGLFAAGLSEVSYSPVIGSMQIIGAVFGSMLSMHIIVAGILIFRHADGIF